jgi:gliding motility-associated-like protein
MRKIILFFIAALFSFTAFSQDFSNKGKEFWLCFPNHVPSPNTANPTGRMSIWITSDQASSGTISMTNGAFNATFNILANQIQEIDVPFATAHIFNSESGSVIQKSIKISVNPGQPAVVAYAQQYGNARSAATLLLPTNVLGKKYRAYSHTYSNTSATPMGGFPTQFSRSQFQIIATRPNTNVTITPLLNGVAQAPINLALNNVGDMYQYQETSDVTGTLIESVAGGGGGCSPIAVFSGSSAATIGYNDISNTPQNCNGASFDPLFQQLYPISTWGKSFGFIPFGDYTRGNPYRVMASEDNTVVSFNGIPVATLNAGQIFPSTFSLTPPVLKTVTSITADKPISVAQYSQTSACSGTNNGDPDMVILNPIEQNIKDITVFTSTQQNINRQWINVLIPTVSAPSFRINGVVPTTPFIPAVNIPGFSYLTHQFIPATNGSRFLSADTGFNAILYGFQGGQFESYAYSAGTNVRDLNTQLEVNNPNTSPSETSPTACTGSPFQFKVFFPNQDNQPIPQDIRYDSMKWEVLPNGAAFTPNNFPVMVYGTVGTPPKVVPDSINIRNGKQVAWYSIPGFYNVNTTGIYTIRITVYRTSTEGCGNELEYEFPLTVSNPPTASFTAPAPGCYLEPVVATETTPQTPRATYRMWWEFFDPVTNVTTVYSGTGAAFRTATHTFTTPGPKRIRHASITTPGCLSDTIVNTVTLPEVPNGSIAGTTSVCTGAANPDITVTMVDGRAPYRFIYSINGVAQPPIISPTGTYNISVPTGTPGTYIYELTEVRNDGSTVCVRPITGQTATVIVRPLPNAAIAGATTVCLNAAQPTVTFTGSNATAPYTIAYTINGVAQTPIVTNAAGVATVAAPTNAVGTFIYEITQITDASSNTCSRNITATTTTITVQDLPNAIIASSTTAVCQNAAQPTVTFTGSTGTANYTFAYTINGVAQTPVVSNAAGVATLNVPTGTVGTFIYEITQVTEGSPRACVRAITGQAVTVDVRPLPNAAIAGAVTVCLNSAPDPVVTFTGSNATPNYTFAYTINGVPQTPVVSNNAGVATVNAPTNVVGTFVYAITQITDGSSTACSRTITGTSTTITIQDLPNGVIASSTTAACLNSTPLPTITFTGNTGTAPYTFTYTINGVTQPTVLSNAAGVATINVPTNVATTYTYELTGISEASTQLCARTNITGQSRVVVINPLPTATITGGIAVCRNASQPTVTFTGADATAPYTFNYTINGVAQPPLVSNAAGVATILAPTNVAGTFTYQLTSVRDASSTLCSQAQTGSTVITINDLPVASFTPPAIRCANSGITFTNTSTPNAASATYNWDFGDGNTSTDVNPTHVYPIPNTAPGYTVTLTVTNSNGCISNPIATAVVPVNDTPRAGFIVPEVCINDVATVFTDTSRINTGNTINGWFWNYGDPASGPANTATTQNGVHLYPAPNVYQVMHVAISNFGCRDTITQPITINSADPNAAFNILNRNTLCSSDSVDLQNISTVGFGSVTKLDIYWDNLGAPATFQTIDVPVFNGIIRHKYPTLQTNRNYQIRVVAYSGNVCFTSRIDNITVYANPVVQFNNIPPTCLLVAPFQITQGSEIGGVPGAGTYSGTGITNPNGTFSPQVAGVGTHAIKYTFTASNPGACVDTLTRFITVLETAQSLFTVSSPTCDGQAVTFTDNSDPRGNTLQTITWDFGHAPPNNTATSLPGQAITHVFPAFGFYDVRMFTTSSVGCLSTPRTIRIYVSPIPNPVFAPERVHYCLPSESNVRFINNSTIADGSALTYSWNFDDPNATPSNPNTSTALSPSHNYTSVGPFRIRLTATSPVGCSNFFDYNLTTVHPQPKAAFSSNKPSVCIRDGVIFTDESDPKDGTTITRHWDVEGDGTFEPGDISPTKAHTYPTIGTYAPTLYITNSFGCKSDTLPKVFIVHPYPEVNAGKDRTILEFGSVKLDPTATGSGLEYLWTPNIYFNNNNRIKQPTASLVKEDITYKLTVTNEGGCTNSDDVFIKVLKFPQIPNTFTPNGDGINDVWRIEYLDSYPNCRVQVFNRTGQTVFESKGIYKSWNGTMQGKELPFDTYYYVIEPGNGRDPVTGYVTIVK